jgi:voltage-gated potassium channel
MATSGGAWGQLQEFARRQLLPRRHTVQLVALVVAFAVRPLLVDVGFAPLCFSIALILLMLVSLYTIQVDELVGERESLLAQKKRSSKIGWLLAIPAVVERIAYSVVQNHYLVVTGVIFWLLFFIYITWNELRAVLRQKEVTGETISLSISIYLLFGLTWGLLYIVIYYLQPHAFSFGGSAISGTEVYPVLVYFSLTTISTVGFGDITPLTLQARYAAVAEGITGQFYLAILVARLVGLYMSRTAGITAGESDPPETNGSARTDDAKATDP